LVVQASFTIITYDRQNSFIVQATVDNQQPIQHQKPELETNQHHDNFTFFRTHFKQGYHQVGPVGAGRVEKRSGVSDIELLFYFIDALAR
jgi:hypothetical protein